MSAGLVYLFFNKLVHLVAYDNIFSSLPTGTAVSSSHTYIHTLEKAVNTDLLADFPAMVDLVHRRIVSGDVLMHFLELFQEDNGADQGSDLSCRQRRREVKNSEG